MPTPVDRYQEARNFYNKLSKTSTRDKVIINVKKEFSDLTPEEIDQIWTREVLKTEDTKVVLKATDWETKFFVQSNRSIKQRYVQLYHDSGYEKITRSMFHLLKVGNNKYRILDGQHRILALIALANETGLKFDLHCTVYPICHFETELEICNLIKEINVSNKQTKGDMLEIFRDQSPWYNTAVKLGIEKIFSFTKARNVITWPNVVESYIFCKHMLQESIMKRVSITEDSREEVWIKEDHEEINKYIQFLDWYYPYALRATQELGLTNFNSTETISIIAAIYFDNIGIIDNMDTYINRLLRHRELKQISYTKSNMADIARFILVKMNYGVTHHLIDLFGETGRDAK